MTLGPTPCFRRARAGRIGTLGPIVFVEWVGPSLPGTMIFKTYIKILNLLNNLQA